MKRRLAVIGIMVVAALALAGCLGPINEALIAAFTYTQDGSYLSFSASSSIGTIDKYSWWFGDGEDGTGLTVTHEYDNPGTYTVRLIVFDAQGNSDEVTLDVTINAVDPVDPVVCQPDAVIIYSPKNNIQTDSVVTFRGTNSIGGNNAPIDRGCWSFGDGSLSVEGPWVGPYPSYLPCVSVVTHTYAAVGTYWVTLTIVDRNGEVGTEAVQIVVK